MSTLSVRSTAWRRVAVAAAFVAASTCSQAANLFLNPGFETGTFADWTTGSAPVVTNTEAHTGKFSFAGMSSDNISQTFAPVATSSITELSFWGKRIGGLFDLVVLTYSDSSSGNVLVNTIGKGDGWTFVDITGDLDAGKSLSGFQIYGTTPGPAYLDDFNLQAAPAIPEPSTYALMILGLGAIGFIGRRRKA